MEPIARDNVRGLIISSRDNALDVSSCSPEETRNVTIDAHDNDNALYSNVFEKKLESF